MNEEMNEERIKEYLTLIQKLMQCPSGQENDILQKNKTLIDIGLLQVMEQVANRFTKAGKQDEADFILGVAQQLTEMLELPAAPSEAQARFLIQVLRAVDESQGDSQVVYPLLQANMEQVNISLIPLLQGWIKTVFSQIEDADKPYMSSIICLFGDLMSDCPFGDKTVNLEISVMAYRSAEIIFTREAFPEQWAMIQKSLEKVQQMRAED
jgi:hypothetical protein